MLFSCNDQIICRLFAFFLHFGLVQYFDLRRFYMLMIAFGAKCLYLELLVRQYFLLLYNAGSML